RATDDLPDQGHEQHRREEEGGEPDEEPNEPHRANTLRARRGARQGHVGLEKPGVADYTVRVTDSFKEFEATSLFCSRCQRATPVRKKLLLVLPTGIKYDYTCSICGGAGGGQKGRGAARLYPTTLPPPPPGPARPPPRRP